MHFAYQLFDKVFTKYDGSSGTIANGILGLGTNSHSNFYLSDDFSYNGMSFEQIKDKYMELLLEDLRDILYLYDITMKYKNYGQEIYPVYKHRENVRYVTKYIEDRINEETENYSMNKKTLEKMHNIKFKNIQEIRKLYDIKSGKKQDITDDDLENINIGIDI